MEIHALFLFSLITIYLSGAQSVTFTFSNNCPFTIWPGTLTGAGKPQLALTGFQLETRASTNIDAPPGWSGRFWARSHCTTDATGKFSCGSGDCASGQIECLGAGAIPPATLIELTLGENGGQDFYDISLVDGFNLPVTLAPHGGCAFTSCPMNVNAACPAELAVNGSGGSVIACKSACLAFNQPEYCCTGQFGSPNTCPPTDYSKIFKSQCPQAYSYAYDDKTSTFTCSGASNYVVTFCPYHARY